MDESGEDQALINCPVTVKLPTDRVINCVRSMDHGPRMEDLPVLTLTLTVTLKLCYSLC